MPLGWEPRGRALRAPKQTYAGGMAQESLPLFPLGTVLVPGTRLPLQVFEPRYVALLRDLVDHQDERDPVFGVVAIKEGHEVGEENARTMHQVGCGAQVTQIAVVAPNRFLVVSEATRRFALDAIDATSETPYATGFVTWLDEPVGDPETVGRLSARLRAEITAYRSLAHADDVDLLALDATALSYATTATVALTLSDRQRLLAAPDTESRLRLALALVRREHLLATSLGSVTVPFEPPSF